VHLLPLDAATAAQRGAGAAVEGDGVPFLVSVTAEPRAHLDEVAPDVSHLAVDDGGGVVAVVRAVRLRWDGRPGGAPSGGVGEALTRHDEQGADSLAVLDVRVAAAHRGRGVGTTVLDRLPDLAGGLGLDRTLVLLRPHGKADHPLTPFTRYLHATGEDPTAPFDGWLRAAWGVGLRPVAAIDRSLVTSAPLEAWSRWCGGRRFPTSGPEVVPGAIKPAVIEFERGEGRYREPHLWAATERDLADPPPAGSGWVGSLAHVGLVPGDRTHREVVRRR
jgi:GNAT superfamily N-acetyltransferase